MAAQAEQLTRAVLADARMTEWATWVHSAPNDRLGEHPHWPVKDREAEGFEGFSGDEDQAVQIDKLLCKLRTSGGGFYKALFFRYYCNMGERQAAKRCGWSRHAYRIRLSHALDWIAWEVM